MINNFNVNSAIKRSKLHDAIICALSVGIVSGAAQAQEQSSRVVEEVIITATKHEESLQDVPIAVTALSGESLDELGVANFSDYVLQLPGVTAGGSGPG